MAAVAKEEEAAKAAASAEPAVQVKSAEGSASCAGRPFVSRGTA